MCDNSSVFSASLVSFIVVSAFSFVVVCVDVDSYLTLFSSCFFIRRLVPLVRSANFKLESNSI